MKVPHARTCANTSLKAYPIHSVCPCVSREHPGRARLSSTERVLAFGIQVRAHGDEGVDIERGRALSREEL